MLNEIIEDASNVFLDTAPIIYLVEEKAPYFQQLAYLFDRIDQGSLFAFASPITLAECLYYPYKHNDRRLIQAFTQRLVAGRHTRFTPTTAAIADKSAQLRAEKNLGFADALQIASAIMAGCEFFLTNDKQLKRVDDIRMVVLEDFVP